MPVRTRPSSTRLATAVALLALVVACGGTAVAAGLAKDSVTSRAIKNNAVKTKDIKDATIRSVDVKDGALTGADIAEGSLGTVPNATAVGGVRVTPLSVSLPSGANEVPVLSESGTVVSLDCGGSLVVEYGRGAAGPPIVVTNVTTPGNTLTTSLAPGESATANLPDGMHTASIVLPGGGSVTAEFTGIYEANAAGTNDCFYRGTVTRVP